MKQFNPPAGGPKGAPGMMPPPRKMNIGVLKRLLKMLFGFYPVLLPVSIVCIIFCAVTSAIPAIFRAQSTRFSRPMPR